MRHQKTRHKLSRDAVAPQGAARQPLQGGHRARAHQDDRGQGQGGQARGREADHAGQARRPARAPPGAVRRSGRTSSPSTSCSRRSPRATRSGPAATRASSSSARAGATRPRWSSSSWSERAPADRVRLSSSTTARTSPAGRASPGSGRCRTRSSAALRTRPARGRRAADRRGPHRPRRPRLGPGRAPTSTRPSTRCALNALLPADVAVLDCDAGARRLRRPPRRRRRGPTATACYTAARARCWLDAAARCGRLPRSTATRCDACAAALAGAHDFTAFTPTETEHVRFERDVLARRSGATRRRPARVLDHGRHVHAPHEPRPRRDDARGRGGPARGRGLRGAARRARRARRRRDGAAARPRARVGVPTRTRWPT